jgi:tRNA A-37 threonylcarbamoyl transferase component Bud32
MCDWLTVFSINIRINVLSQIYELHRAGIQHNNVKGSSVLFNVNGPFGHHGPYIIDFAQATKHDCGVRLAVVEGAVAPTRIEFGCDELWNLTLDLELWRPGNTFFSCSVIHVSRTRS